jgi:hypothetical protein
MTILRKNPKEMLVTKTTERNENSLRRFTGRLDITEERFSD